MKAKMIVNVYEGLNARSEVYLSKEYFGEMYLTCVSTRSFASSFSLQKNFSHHSTHHHSVFVFASVFVSIFVFLWIGLLCSGGIMAVRSDCLLIATPLFH